MGQKRKQGSGPRKTLLIAEKPIQGREIAEALLAAKGWSKSSVVQPNGVLLNQGSDLLLITWAEGHLLEMLKPDELHPEWGSPWRSSVLPMLPRGQWIPQQPRSGLERRVNIIVRWIQQSDEVINACDAGPEGELIFDELLRIADINLDVQTNGATYSRMWISDTRPIGLVGAYDERSRCSLVKYQRLREGAWARSQADWLIGFNLTRMASLAFQGADVPKVVVGRVQSPTLGVVVRHDKKIAEFKPETFHLAPIKFKGQNGVTFEAKLVAFPHLRFGNCDTHFHPDQELFDIRQFLMSSKQEPWVIKDQAEERFEGAPAPFDLLDLQQSANRIYGWTAAKTLSLAQTLYASDKAITYPRTSCSNLPGEMKEEVLRIREELYYGWVQERFKGLSGAVLTTEEESHWGGLDGDHHAIIPTGVIPKAWCDDNALRDEFRLWTLIVVRMVLAWLPPARIAAVKRHLLRPWKDNIIFRAYVEAEPVDDPGWLWWEDKMMNTRGYGLALSSRLREAAMPIAGQYASIDMMEIKSGATAPPEIATDASILFWMARTKLGTPATRHQIIEDLIDNGYLTRAENGKVRSSHAGRVLINLIEEKIGDELTGDKTARYLEEFIARIGGMAKDRPSRAHLWNILGERLRGWKKQILSSATHEQGTPSEEEHSVFCPRTGERVSVHESGKFYQFAGYKDAKCWRSMCGREMSPKDYATILAAGERGGGPFTEFVSRTGSKYDAYVVWRPKKKRFELLFKR